MLVTGTPGVGKSFRSRKFASTLNAVCINPDTIAKTENLIICKDEERGSLIVDTPNLSKRLIELINRFDRDVIIDSHYAVDVVPPKEVRLTFVLRRDPR